MVSVRKRRLRSGKVRWQVDYRDRDGCRRHRQFARKSEAESYETKIRGELLAGVHVADSASISVRDAANLWLARAENENLEASTIRQYRQHVEHHINPLIGDTKLTRLTVPQVEVFKDALLLSRSRPLSRAVLTSLKGILKEAQRRGLLGHNPASPVGVRESKRNKSKLVIPTKEEIRGMLRASIELWPLTRVETSRKGEKRTVAVPWQPFIETAIFTGLRCSELRGLTWSHVELQEQVIRVRQRADFVNDLGPPKSAAGIREVPIGPRLIGTIKQWRVACPRLKNDLVFPTENGTIHSNSNIHKQCWGPLLRRLGLVEAVGTADVEGNPVERPRYTFHSLRHVAASLFIEQGWTPKKVQTVMGHSSIQVTFDTYGHLWKNAEADAEAVAEIERRLLA